MSIYSMILRLGIAVLLGGLLGYEREYNNRPAGLRTHILVCVGAAIISMIQVRIIEDTYKTVLLHPEMAEILKTDIGRLGAQVVSGIGFLGAGTIIHDKGSVKGLTTAASIWITACTGLSIGMGYYLLSFMSVITVLLVIVCMKRVETNFFDRIRAVKLEVEYYYKLDLTSALTRYFDSKNIEIKEVAYVIEKGAKQSSFRKCVYTILVSKQTDLSKVQHEINNIHHIVTTRIIKS